MTPELNRVHLGDVLTTLRSWPDNFVQTVVTSPPYWGLRDYGTSKWEGGDPACDHSRRTSTKTDASTLGSRSGNSNHEKEGWKGGVCGRCGARRTDLQIGLEGSPQEYVQKLVEVFLEVRRVLRPDGTLWLNLGDSYANGGGAGKQGQTGQRAGRRHTQERLQGPKSGLGAKNLLGMPWRVAFALQEAGWTLRQRIVWAKGVSFRPDFSGSCMPESATDRPTTSCEEIFLLTKLPHYFYDAEAVSESGRIAAGVTAAKGSSGRAQKGVNGRPPKYWEYSGRRNLRSVWAINPDPFPEAHFATFPIEIPDTCIKAGTSEKGACSVCGAPWVRATKGWKPGCSHKKAPVRPCIVADPFTGAGTTFLAAARLRRDFVGVELNQEYCDMTDRRVKAELEQTKLGLVI